MIKLGLLVIFMISSNIYMISENDWYFWAMPVSLIKIIIYVCYRFSEIEKKKWLFEFSNLKKCFNSR